MQKNKGQIALEFQNALLLMMLFTTALLAVEVPMLQKIIDKQNAQYEQTKNIHNCALNDLMQTYHTQGIKPVTTNGTCLYTIDTATGKGGLQGQDKREFG